LSEGRDRSVTLSQNRRASIFSAVSLQIWKIVIRVVIGLEAPAMITGGKN
jgi:hypothetical protein